MNRPRQRSHESPVPEIDRNSPASTPLYLGLPGLVGNQARRMIPGQLFHCPGLLLLHDPIYVSEALFWGDSESILEATQYRLALQLVERGVLQILPSSNGEFEKDVQTELEDLTEAFFRGSGFDVSRDAVVDWVHHGDVHDLARLCPIEKRPLVIGTTELLMDACMTQAIAERLECPYAFPIEDDPVYGIRWSLSERSAEHQVHAVLRVPIPEGSVLVTDSGEPATILPEIVYTSRKVMNGRVFLKDESGNLTPYVEPSWDRSYELLERVLEAKEDEAITKLRTVLTNWYRTLREMGIPEQSVMEQLRETHEEQLMSLRPQWGPIYQELGTAMGIQRVTGMQSVPQEVPAPTGPARRASPAKGSSPVLFYPEYFGPNGTWVPPTIIVKRG